MIYTIGGIKGGSGKSTHATNLTVMLAKQGHDVLLVDADDQQTSKEFNEWRQDTFGDTGYTFVQLYEKAVASEVLKLSSKYNHIVIDTGGRDTKSQRAAMAISDIYLAPFRPKSFDIWTLEKTEELVSEISTVNQKLKAFSFINEGFHQGKDNEDVAQILKESEVLSYIDAPVRNRKAVSNAASEGRAVIEYKPQDEKAISEFTTLFNIIISM